MCVISYPKNNIKHRIFRTGREDGRYIYYLSLGYIVRVGLRFDVVAASSRWSSRGVPTMVNIPKCVGCGIRDSVGISAAIFWGGGIHTECAALVQIYLSDG